MANPIKTIRNKEEMTQEQCAKLASEMSGKNISQSHWSQFEAQPEMLNLRYDTMRLIAKVLGTNLVGLWLARHKMDPDNGTA